MNRKGILVVISGFSGVGKGTLMKQLISRYDSYALSVSATTRKPREGEQDGREYFFRTKEAFEEMIAAGRLAEYACYCGNYYGTPKDFLEEQMELGRDVILEIEPQGAQKIRAQYPDAFLLFVMPPDAQTLEHRLVGRATESGDLISQRLARAAEEARLVPLYDSIVVNDDLDRCVKELHHLIRSKHCETERNMEFVEQIRIELEAIAKGE